MIFGQLDNASGIYIAEYGHIRIMDCIVFVFVEF